MSRSTRRAILATTVAADLATTALTFETPFCIPDRAAGLYRAQAGARWRDIIATLDPLGFSPTVMQFNNDFGVASTLSVNAHGWPVPHYDPGLLFRNALWVKQFA